MNSSKLRLLFKPIAILMIVFALGAFIGAGMTVLRVKHNLQQATQSDGPHPAIDKALLRLEKQMSKKLDLTPTESAEVSKELKQTAENLVKIRNHTIAELSNETRATLQRIGNRLPEEKRAMMNQIAKERLSPWGLMTTTTQE